MDRQTYLDRKQYLLNFIGLTKSTAELVRDLPGGIKQKVSLAAAMLHDPSIVFLDEPTAGVTPASRASFWLLIRQLADSGKTVFVTSHYLDEVEQCHRIALMRSGEIVALGSAQELKDQEFPHGMLALGPKHNDLKSILSILAKDSRVSSIQPHGLKYHLVPQNTDATESLRRELAVDFEIEKIMPTMEDVFIRVVSGKKHD